MAESRFKGFSADLFGFLRDLAENNNKEWFDKHRRFYREEVLGGVKSFVGEIGPILQMLNEEFEVEPRVGRTISRINNDVRFNRNRSPYRPFVYVTFPRRGRKWNDDALLYCGIYGHGVSVGFWPGGHQKLRVGPVQEAIKSNLRLFQKYLDERRIAKTYSELADGVNGSITRWPLPPTARRWVKLESFSVGEYFPSTDAAVSRRTFLDRVQRVFLDLYPLWLFAVSDNLHDELDLYSENAPLLARPLTKAG
jgi:uncharacterized protein (TIGR02453 family)